MSKDAEPPEGDFLARLRHALLAYEPAIVFDVGANIGQSSAMFVKAFPGAAIYAFEPAQAAFDAMTERLAGVNCVKAFRLALGSRAGRCFVEHGRSSASHRIVGLRRFVTRRTIEETAMTTGDRFSAEHGVRRIDFLKIDTEGGDLAVLKGFRNMLRAQQIGLVETEAGMNCRNRRHVPLARIEGFLARRGYSLFHIHEQVLDSGFSGRPVLRRCNAVFISDALADANRRKPRKRTGR